MGWRETEAKKLAGKKVLMVGAGGIGCELLKNIVLAGFRDIHVIDLDTIDVSNLNRQFLFRREHVGKAKAAVATAAGLRMAPDGGVSITYDHDSIFSEKFNYEFFKQYALVLNALDNRVARNHVNRMCISSRIPLIDGGSAGYLGQVAPIVRGLTECYECEPKPENVKSFPGCTIRNTPSEHIHCTVWSKHVFNQLFGEMDIDDDVSPDMDDEEAKEKKGEDEAPTQEEKNGNGDSAQEKPGNTRKLAEESNYDAETIFNKLFSDDIKYLLRMPNLWKERRQPEPLTFSKLPKELAGSSGSSEKEHADPLQRILAPAEYGEIFKRSVEALKQRKAAEADGILTWDKDDDDAMRFVAACANIRAHIFHIAPKSIFEIKSMAGNIIPAIATTNAIVAAIMTVEALKVIDGDLDSLRSTILWQRPNFRGSILNVTKPVLPTAKCYTCSSKREVIVRCNVEKMTVLTLRDKILKESLDVAEPDVMEATTSKVIVSSEEGETDGLLGDTLSVHGLSSGGRLLVEDFDSGAELRLVILQAASFTEEQFEIIADEKPEKEEKEDEDMKEEVEEGADENKVSAGKKRKTLDEEELPAKKARVEENDVAMG